MDMDERLFRYYQRLQLSFLSGRCRGFFWIAKRYLCMQRGVSRLLFQTRFFTRASKAGWALDIPEGLG